MDRRKKGKRRERREGGEEKEGCLRESTLYVKPCAVYDKDNFILGGGVGCLEDLVRPFSYVDDPEKGGGGNLHSTDLFFNFLIISYFFLLLGN